MFIKMNYEMFAKELNAYTNEQKKIMWDYYRSIESRSKDMKLIFNSEQIKLDWEVYDDLEMAFKWYSKTYPVERWAKDHEEELLMGKQLSYRDSFMDNVIYKDGKDVKTFALSNGGMMIFKG